MRTPMLILVIASWHSSESFNGRFRDECLNEQPFESLNEARA